MKKRIAMLLASTMALSTLAACGGSGSGSGTGGSSTNADGTSTFTFHYHARDMRTFVNDWPVFAEMESITGVKLVNAASEAATNSVEQFLLQAASQFPDDLYGGDNITPYFMQYGPDGAFIPLNEYWDSMPHFRAFLDDHPEVEASITASDGNIYHIPHIQTGDVARAYFIRYDWLETLGLDVPVTTQDFEDVLMAFKTQDPNGNGLADEVPYFNDKWTEMLRLVNLWDARCYAQDSVAERVMPDENGVLYHSWITDEFREGITNLSRWYDLGLIDAEVFTKGTASRVEYLAKDTGGMTHEWIPSTSQYNEKVDIEGFDFSVIAPPVTATGNQWEEHQRLTVKPDGWAISTSCDDPTTLATYIDYFWCEEGRMLSNFGVEGVHYVLNEDGEAEFVDSIMNGDEAVNIYLETKVGAQLKHGYWMDYWYEWQWTNDTGRVGVELYTEGQFGAEAYQLPSLSYTIEEKAIYDKYVSNINAYLDETVQTWILGDYTKIDDATWDAHLAHMDALFVDELVANYQQAYDRYLSIVNG